MVTSRHVSSNSISSHLGGVVVSVLASGPKG
jgi:hypothetical protein